MGCYSCHKFSESANFTNSANIKSFNHFIINNSFLSNFPKDVYFDIVSLEKLNYDYLEASNPLNYMVYTCTQHMSISLCLVIVVLGWLQRDVGKLSSNNAECILAFQTKKESLLARIIPDENLF